MKRIAFACLLFIHAHTVFAQRNIDVINYRYEIELNDKNDTIIGKAMITFKATQSLQSVIFDLTTSVGNNKGMNVGSISIYSWGSILTSTPVYKHSSEGLLMIDLPKKLNEGETLEIMISYKGIPSDGLIISKTKYGRRSFFADNWPNRGHNWLPCNDDPADKASVEFIVTAPQHYQVVANGIQVEETNLPEEKKRTHWIENIPISTKVMVIGVSDFAVNLYGFIDGCIPVYSWVYPEDRDKGFFDYSQAAEILPWFIKNVGPYGYKKLANVQSKTTFGGLENANTIFYAENSVTGKRKSEGLITHEIAHQWFGNMATEKTFAHLWLSEGFATYFTILYMEEKYSRDTAVAMLKEDRDQVIGFAKGNNRSVVDHTKDYMELLNANSYQKGSWVLHMLRSELGDSVFWKSIRRYYSTYAGKTADTKDLQTIFESVSGKKLNTFFDQWLYSPENPKLKITWKYVAKEKRVAITVEQLQSKPFTFPLDIAIGVATSMPQIKKMNIAKKVETFYFPVKSSPVSISADPYTSLLFEGTVTVVK